MPVVEELIRKDADGTLSFGNYLLDTKTKLSDFEYEGDLYKVKTFKEITKLEKNGLFVYESVEGTAVTGFRITEDTVTMNVEGAEDTQITLGLEPDTEYKVSYDGTEIGNIKTKFNGKLVLSVELENGQARSIVIAKA
ncbi:MAG: endosialidase [Lachnospiraceae bacterium]|nr:endosialidase [Lachnospiraceae bacterium]